MKLKDKVQLAKNIYIYGFYGLIAGLLATGLFKLPDVYWSLYALILGVYGLISIIPISIYESRLKEGINE